MTSTVDETGAPRVVEDLTDGEAALLAILHDPSGLDQAEFLWFDPSSQDHRCCRTCGRNNGGHYFPDCEPNWLAKAREAGDERDDEEILKELWFEKYTSGSGCFRAWPYQWIWWRCEDQLQIDQCFPAGTLVLTENGHTPIEEVQLGTRVLTHKGRWKRVTAVFDRGEQELVNVKGHGHFGLKTTPSHEFYVRRLRRRTAFDAPTWLPISATEHTADRHHKWAVPAVVEPLVVPQIAERYAPGVRNDLEPRHLVNRDFWWLVGLFLAEGSTSSSFGVGGKRNRVTWSIHVSEVDHVLALLDGLGFYHREWVNGNVVNVVVNSLTLASFLIEVCGQRADGKSIHPSVFGLKRELRQAVLDGACYGDGHRRGKSCFYTTVSRRLAFDVRQLASTLETQASIAYADRGPTAVIQGRTVNTKPQYMVSLCAEPSKPITTFDGNHGWARISGVTPAGVARAYDLEVEDDHSYVAEGVVVHNCARSVGKSLSIKVRGCAFPFVMPGQEMVVTAPELVHLEPIVGLIESQFYATRFLSEMLPHGRSAVTHRPFQMNFNNKSRIIGRIPQRDGRGVKGLHPIWLELDEAQDYPEPGWMELTETLKRGEVGAAWRAHGVTRGVRDKFFEYTQDSPDNMWTVHRYPAMYRPNWTEQERVQKEAEYGGRNDADYRRNVLGLHGDNTNPIFVLTALMGCVDDNIGADPKKPASDYNTLEYFHPGWGRTKRNPNIVSRDNLRLYDVAIEDILDYPRSHLQYRGTNRDNPEAYFWVGMDVGFTIDPSELLVFVEHWPDSKLKPSQIKLLSRTSMVRVGHHDQIKAILHTIDFYRPRGFGIDKGGHGLPLFMEIQEHLEAFRKKDWDKVPPWMRRYDLNMAINTIKGYNFSEKLVVGVDQSVELGDFDDPWEEASMRRNAKEWATDVLRDLVDAGRLELPWDPDLLRQYSGATVQAARGSADQYGRRLFSKGDDHTLDASRFMALAWVQHSVEAELNQPERHEAVLDRPIFFD